jgi:hypothetical protein
MITGVPPPLRHVQLEVGTSIRALAEHLGHSGPGFTLKVYTHVMPQAEDKAKRAVDDAFDRFESLSTDPLGVPDVAQGDPLTWKPQVRGIRL